MNAVFLTLFLLLTISINSFNKESHSAEKIDFNITSSEFEDKYFLDIPEDIYTEEELITILSSFKNEEEKREFFIKYKMDDSQRTLSKSSSCGVWKFERYTSSTCDNGDGVEALYKRWCGPPRWGGYQYTYFCIY